MSEPVKPQGYECECDCPCGGVMLRKTMTVEGSTYPVAVQCPRCGRTPLDLLQKTDHFGRTVERPDPMIVTDNWGRRVVRHPADESSRES